MNVVGAISCYNEESNILLALQQLEKLEIPYIHIQDGAWDGHGYTSPTSTDRTKQIVEEYKKGQHWRYVVYEESDHIWRTEGEKRNHQLRKIHEQFGDLGRYTVFVLDADENIRFHNGCEKMHLRNLAEGKQGIGLLTCFASGSRKAMQTPRLIEGGKDYHYHTERSMLIHDASCNEVINYDPDAEHVGKPAELYRVPEIFLVNAWNRRPEERIEEKKQWLMSARAKQYDEGQKCQAII